MKIHSVSCTMQLTGEHAREYMGSVTLHDWVPNSAGIGEAPPSIRMVVETGTGWSTDPDKATHFALDNALKKIGDKLHSSLKIGINVEVRP